MSRGIEKPTANAESSDAELMHRLAERDMTALGEIYLRYSDVVRSVAYRYLGALPKTTVEDLCQDVFLALLDLAPRYNEQGKLRSFLCGVTIRKARSKRRSDLLHRVLLGRFAKSGSDASAEGRAAAHHDTQKALHLLPEPQRDVLLLHTVEGLSGEEIAVALDIEVKTVWTRLHRARAKLREHFERDDARAQGDEP
jgi:RNA polymerase sigma factor (sigma-70 family)